jgi:hypothetical protein
MSDEPPAGALTLLTYALDEMRETTALLPVPDLARQATRPWWHNIFIRFVPGKDEVSAGFAVQFLAENLERARAHWREALSLLDHLQRDHSGNEVVVQLGPELRAAGIDEVLPRLGNDALPHSLAATTAHLAGVVATIRECDRLALGARNKLTLQRMRNEKTSV